MGGFYGSIQVRSDDRDDVRKGVEGLARKKRRFLVGPPLNGWIGVYPDGAGQDLSLTGELAKRLPGELVGMTVHDDDIFAYEYYRDGKQIDQYNSEPDYFGEISTKEKRALRGRPELFAHLATDREKFRSMQERIAAKDLPGFASELLVEFAEALGIRNALTSYEYLHEHEETDDIEGWDEFVHIPDLSDERKAKRAAEAELASNKDWLIRGGLLLAERGGLTGFPAPSPLCCSSPDGRGFLVAWSSHADAKQSTCPLERHSAPWSAGPVTTRWTVGSQVYGLELSPSGRYLAAAYASGDWRATLWDLQDNRLVADTPQVRAVSSVGFLPDESAMFSVSSDGDEGKVILSPVDGSAPRVFTLPHANLAAAHPSGKALAMVDGLNRLLVLDLGSGSVTRTHFLGGRYVASDLERQFSSQVQAQLANIDLDEMEKRARQVQEDLLKKMEKAAAKGGDAAAAQLDTIKKAFDAQIPAMREQFAHAQSSAAQTQPDRGIEHAFCLRFDPSGERVFVATMLGVRVYAWREILEADPGKLRAALTVDVAGTVVGNARAQVHAGGYVYHLDYDSERDRLLFAGLEGRVRFLDLASGRSGILLSPPGTPAIHKLTLSRDRSTLLLVTMPDMYSQARSRRGPVLQFWDYRAISQEST